MDIFAKASRSNLLFYSGKGQLTLTQVWQLGVITLATMIREVKANLTTAGSNDGLDFLEDVASTQDPEEQLRFDILKFIYQTKKAEQTAIRDEAAKKANNERIMALISQKQEQKLAEMSEDDLRKLLM